MNFPAPFVATFLVLYLLAVTDCAFASYRSAGGRVALINKGSLAPRALLRGALFANVPVAIAAAVGWWVCSSSGSPQLILDNFTEAGQRMLSVYVPFAVICLVALSLQCIHSVDARSMSQVLILGPFTFLRPLVALAGVVYAMSGAMESPIYLAVIPVMIGMLCMQPFFDMTSRYPNFASRHASLRD